MNRQEIIDRAYAWADGVRVALGKKPRPKRACGTPERCPLEAHINVKDLTVGAGYFSIWGMHDPKQRAVAARLREAGYKDRFGGTLGSYTQFAAPAYVREFTKLADTPLHDKLPPEIQGRWL